MTVIFLVKLPANCVSIRGGGGALTSQLGRGCHGGGVKTWPCLKPLGAQKIHPVTIYLT